MNQKSYTCFSCNKSLLDIPLPVGRRDTCPACDSDLHCCKNCLHYDESCYNECREPQAERVLEKDRSNYCDYFTLKSSSDSPKDATSKKEDVLKQLDDLFK